MTGRPDQSQRASDADDQPPSEDLGNRLAGPIDGVLHLLDRQLLDCNGEFLGKVDDVELTEDAGTLVVTGVLTGPAALLDRFGGRLGRLLVARWHQMRVSEPRRTVPWRIDISDIDRLDSALHLRVPRDGVLSRDHERRRLGRLTGMDVYNPEGLRIGRVTDVRFEPVGPGDSTPRGATDSDVAGQRLVMTSLIVGHGRPGSMLGYDRRSEQGPWLVKTVVRWLHRHTVIVDAADAEIDWASASVRLSHHPVEHPAHPFR